MLRKSIVCGILLLLVGASIVQGINRNTDTTALTNIIGNLNHNILTFFLTDDAYFSLKTPDQNNGDLYHLDVRNRYDGMSNDWENDIVIQFDFSEIGTNANISSASLYLYYYVWFDTNPVGRTLNLHRLTSDWDEDTVTWNTRPDFNPTVSSFAVVPSDPGVWITWNVTSDVQSFVNGTVTNYGWQIMDEEYWGLSNIPNSLFYSKEYGSYIPYLEILIEERNEPPTTPGTPDGPSSRKIGESGLYSTSAVDPDTDDVLYLWDWDGDGVFDEWTSYYASGQTVSTSHSWSTAGRYDVRVKAEDEHGAQSEFSAALTVVVSEESSNPPSKPHISGPVQGNAGISYTYSAMAIDPDGDQVEYLFDWDDGTDSGWKGLHDSGETCYVSHIWDAQGTYSITVKARDIYGVESPWSDPLLISMPKAKATNQLFVRLCERFPVLARLLHHGI